MGLWPDLWKFSQTESKMREERIKKTKPSAPTAALAFVTRFGQKTLKILKIEPLTATPPMPSPNLR